MNTPAEIEQVLADFAITTHILGALKVNPHIPVNEVEVITKNGCVTLNGNIQWDFQLGIINNVVKNITGVKLLDNKIAVVPFLGKNSIWSFSAN
jgi:osmotically-inducible protein OsmY